MTAATISERPKGRGNTRQDTRSKAEPSSWEEQLHLQQGQLLSGAARGPIWETEMSTKEFLEASREEARRIIRDGIEKQCRDQMNLLVGRRKIPPYYFRQEAQAAGVDREVYQKWHIRDWPPRDFGDNQELFSIALAVLKVHLRLFSHQEPETYEEAMRQVSERIAQALESGRSRHSLSQEIRIRNPALETLLEREPGREVESVCPWEILKRLSRHNGSAPRLPGVSLRKGESLAQPPVPEIHPHNEVDHGDNCHHCGAGWPTLAFESAGWIGLRAWHIYTCQSCTRDNLVQPPDQETYGPCANCSMPYHHLRGRTKDSDGNTVKNCLSCKRVSLVRVRPA